MIKSLYIFLFLLLIIFFSFYCIIKAFHASNVRQCDRCKNIFMSLMWQKSNIAWIKWRWNFAAWWEVMIFQVPARNEPNPHFCCYCWNWCLLAMHSAMRCSAISFLEVSTTFQYSRETEWQHGRHCQGIIFYQRLISQDAGTDCVCCHSWWQVIWKYFSCIFFC